MDIRIVETPHRFALITRESCAHDSIGGALAKILPWCYRCAAEHIAEKPPLCRYTAWRETDCDIEGGCFVDGPFEPPIGTRIIEMPPGRAVFAEHKGSYETLVNTHNAILAFMHAEGLEFSGPPWEQYMSDPTTTAEEDVITHVYCPVN